MSASGKFVRGIDEALLEEMRHILIRQYGTFYGHQADVLNEALRLWLESKQRRATTLTKSKNELRPDVIARLDEMRLGAAEYLEDVGSFETRQIPLSEIERIVQGQVKDRRTMVQYLKRLLDLGYLEPLNPHVYRITPSWVPDPGKPRSPPSEE